MDRRKKGLLNEYHIIYIPLHFLLMFFIGSLNKDLWYDCNGINITIILIILSILDVLICFFIFQKAWQKYRRLERISIRALMALLAYNAELFLEVALNIPLQFANVILSDPEYYFSHVPCIANHVHHCMWGIITFFTLASLLIALASQFRCFIPKKK